VGNYRQTVRWRQLSVVLLMMLAALVIRSTPPLRANQALPNDESTREVIVGISPSHAERVQRATVDARSSGIAPLNALAAQYQVVSMTHLYDNTLFGRDSRALANGLVGTLVVTLPRGVDVNRFMADAEQLPEVAYAEVNYRVQLLAPAQQTKPVLINGVTATTSDATAQASIRLKGSRNVLCSATIVDQKWVLTAAQCVQGRRTQSVEVVAGMLDVRNSRGAQIRAVQRIQIHPNYNRAKKLNDVALLELTTPFKLASNIQVAKIALTHRDVDMSKAIMLGWGISQPGAQPLLPNLRKSDAQIKNTDACKKQFGASFAESLMCADPVTINRTRTQLCNSDVGGALSARGTDGLLYTVGVASTSLVCTDRNPGVYTDLTTVTTWIDEFVPILPEPEEELTPDPLFGDQWGLANSADTDIDVNEAWALSRGNASILIAVIDTGVSLTHADLVGPRLRTDIDYDFVNNDATADDDNGHGTHVAGIIGASTNNGIGVAGICANCEILPVKVLDAEGSGDVESIAKGLRHAADQGADIANMSLGMDPNCGCSETLANAINYAYERGMFMIAASGNDGIEKVGYPASSSRVLAVGATNIAGNRAYFSNYGVQLDIVAPGHNVLSTYTTPEYDEASGTSMASPMVAGVAGLALSARSMSQAQLWWLLINATDSATPGSFNNQLGFGRINAYSALTLPIGPATTVVADTCDESQNPTCNDCSLDFMLGSSAESQSQMRMLYTFRDNVLRSHATGQRLQNLFYRHTIELLGIMARHEPIRRDADALLTLFEPAIRGMVNQQTDGLTFTQAQFDAARAFKDALQPIASPRMNEEIEAEWQRIAPERFVGQSIDSIWQTLAR